VQWRSETRATSANVKRCAKQLVAAADRALAASSRIIVPILFISDLYNSTSSTLKKRVRRRRPLKGLCRAALHKAATQGDAHVRALHIVEDGLFQGSAAASASLMRRPWGGFDGGVG
jgi:hypothetical protein